MARIVMQPSGKSVDCAYGDTVLMALEKAGYALPNNCRAGACGECKVKVTGGQFDQGMVLDMALSQDERKQGYGLMCMAKPISEELVIEWGTEDAKPKLFPPREDALFVVTDKRADRRPRRRAAPAPGRPADPLLARPVRHHRQPARRHPGPRLFDFQRPAPGRRACPAGRPRRRRRHQQLDPRQPADRRERQDLRRLRHLHRRPVGRHPGPLPRRRHRPGARPGAGRGGAAPRLQEAGDDGLLGAHARKTSTARA